MVAAAYLFHIAQNHAFHDGNKRTAALSALIFLEVNGVELLPEPDALERTTMAVAASRCGKQELEQWMRRQLDPGGADGRGRHVARGAAAAWHPDPVGAQLCDEGELILVET